MTTHATTGYLGEAPQSDGAQRLYDADLADDGYVMNLTRVWAHQPEARAKFGDLVAWTTKTARLTPRQMGILVTACASTRGDSYCSLAWGNRLAQSADPTAAGTVLRGEETGLDASDLALARWARSLARNPNATEQADVDELREAGFDDEQILLITLYVGLRIAFSTINAGLGAQPDRQLLDAATAPVRDAVTYGRPTA